jgi:hypothetical protein
MNIEITNHEEEVSYIVEEMEDCRNLDEMEAFYLCQRHKSAVHYGVITAAPACDCMGTDAVAWRRDKEGIIMHSCIECWHSRN